MVVAYSYPEHLFLYMSAQACWSPLLYVSAPKVISHSLTVSCTADVHITWVQDMHTYCVTMATLVSTLTDHHCLQSAQLLHHHATIHQLHLLNSSTIALQSPAALVTSIQVSCRTRI